MNRGLTEFSCFYTVAENFTSAFASPDYQTTEEARKRLGKIVARAHLMIAVRFLSIS